MNQLRREAPDSIVDKGPILLGTEPPKGYLGIRTTVQIRDFRNGDPGERNDFVLDAVINTDIRRGPRSSNYKAAEQQVATDHREVIGLLLEAIKQASECPKKANS